MSANPKRKNEAAPPKDAAKQAKAPVLSEEVRVTQSLSLSLSLAPHSHHSLTNTI